MTLYLLLVYIVTVDHKGHYCGQRANSRQQKGSSGSPTIFDVQTDRCRDQCP